MEPSCEGDTMKRRDLIDKLAGEAKVEQKKVDDVLRALQATLEDAASKGETLTVPGFLSMKVSRPSGGSVVIEVAGVPVAKGRQATVRAWRGRRGVTTQRPRAVANAKSAAVEIFVSHGIEIDDERLAEVVDDVLTDMPGESSDALPAGEAELYDSVGFIEDPEAYQYFAAEASARFAALLHHSDSVEAAATRLGVSRGRVQQMISARDVWAIRNRNRWLVPQRQFNDGKLLPGWSRVCKALPEGLHPLEILGLLNTPQPELALGGKPMAIQEWLLSGGDPQAAIEIAASLDLIGV